ncbi:hypothetical protein Sste5346_004441 [Sporothrix stenoceras]|uniref:Heterokaryon incompatibility domain-containing protein n=1 Tax=Sporothrix stenoceras TaxID=5173 RepID=A0ABR3Z8B3_9PEZI
MSFTYQPLSTTRNEIRLLRLRPAASYDEPLRINLFHASLDDTSEYEALSYVWGKTWGKFSVLVDDGSENVVDDLTKLPTLPITPNLDMALRHVRYHRQDRILWVDALCINQQDPAERSRQVQQMRHIYESCTADVAYLGPRPSTPVTEDDVDRVDTNNAEAKAAQEVGAFEGETEGQATERREANESAWKRRKAETYRVRAYKNRARMLRDGLALMRQVANRDVAALSVMVQNWNKQSVFSRYDHKGEDEEDEKQPPKDEYDPANPGQKRFLSSTQVSTLWAAFSFAELWSRVWIVQELSCAPRVLLAAGKPRDGEPGSEEEDARSTDSNGETIVVVGSNDKADVKEEDDCDMLDTLDWDKDIVGGFLDDHTYTDAFHSSWSHGTVGPVASNIFARVRAIHLQRQMIRSRNELKDGKSIIKRPGWRGRFKEESELERQLLKMTAGQNDEDKKEETAVPPDPSLINVLARFKWTQATDARDKVYGLLGLVAEAPRLPPVNYTQPVARVYSDAAIAIIETSGSLDVISQNPFDGDEGQDPTDGTGNEGGRAPNLPSWVPNFDRSFYTDHYDEFATILFAQRGIYAAGKPDCKHLLPLKVEQGSVGIEDKDTRIPFSSIRLRGTILGRIAPLKQGPWEEEGQRYVGTQVGVELFRKYKRLYYDGIEEGEKAKVYALTGEPLWDAFWRTIIGDCRAYPIRRLTTDERTTCSTGLTEVCRLRETELEKEREETKNFTTDEEWELYREKNRYNGYTPAIDYAEELPVAQMLRRMTRRWGMAQTLEDSKLPSGGGLLLMVRAEAQPGDVVAALDGSKVPVVLRAQDVTVVKVGETNNGTVSYKYVCPAYVHGYMDGEAVAQVEGGRLTEQDFVLV